MMVVVVKFWLWGHRIYMSGKYGEDFTKDFWLVAPTFVLNVIVYSLFILGLMKASLGLANLDHMLGQSEQKGRPK